MSRIAGFIPSNLMMIIQSHMIAILSLALQTRATNWASAFQYYYSLPQYTSTLSLVHKNHPTQYLQHVIPKSIVRSTTPLESSEQLPDYGKTSVDIDQHTLDARRTRWRRPELFGTSIIKDTSEDPALPATVEMTKEQRLKRRRALDNLGITSFNQYVSQKQGNKKDESSLSSEINKSIIKTQGLKRKQPKVLQLNIGLYCNQACNHCHVESSPLRKEMMSSEVASQCLELLKNTPSIQTLDITGGEFI